jgi:TRAP-type C4-dicarboxylate transport system permease small subunit
VLRLLTRISDWTDWLVKLLAVPVGIGFILIVFFGVLTRYVFRTPIITSIELARLGFVWCCFLGAALGVKRQKHVQFVFLVENIGGLGRRLVRTVVSALSSGFFLFLVIKGTEMVQAVQGTYFPALGLSQVWLYLPLPLSGLAMLIHGLDYLARDLRGLLGGAGT